MDTPLITWGCIVGLFVLIIFVRLAHALIFCAKGHHRFISFGSEREEIFVPGDPDPSAPKDYDYDDFDDL